MVNKEPATVQFKSSVFSMMNTLIPLIVAPVILMGIALTPRGNAGTVMAYASCAIGLALIAAAAGIFHHLVVTFDGREVVFRYAFIKKRIPLETIYSAQTHDIKWLRFGGTGIRIRRDGVGWIAGSGPGVKLETTRGNAYANCDRPEQLVALVEDAIRTRGAGS
ncbi:MAG: hypothetical protein PVH29_00555 [Candidatus Zixiibacteriota bacterium]|jgi:hypothetical protein